MPPAADGGIDSASDDDLIEIHAVPVNRRAQSGLILPQPSGMGHTPQNTTSTDTRSRPRQRPAPPPPPPPPVTSAAAAAAAPPRQDGAVIDLTEEPDSPVLERAPRLPSIRTGPGRNPRRTNSQRITPPRLSRSESILLASQTSFIDLTGDDDVEEVLPDHPPRRSQRNSQRPRLRPNDQLFELEFINAARMSEHHQVQPGGMSAFVGGFGRALADMLSTDFIRGGFRPTRVNIPYPPAPPRREPTPKPPMSPPPPTRSGFTRDTCAEPEEGVEVVVCPACNEELGYDPSGTAVQATPGGQKKRKRPVGDHHFWALKKCGHVYCADCFENRKPTRANPNGVGFRYPSGSQAAPNDLVCAVDSCTSKVTNKGEWVGIFL